MIDKMPGLSKGLSPAKAIEFERLSGAIKFHEGGLITSGVFFTPIHERHRPSGDSLRYTVELSGRWRYCLPKKMGEGAALARVEIIPPQESHPCQLAITVPGRDNFLRVIDSNDPEGYAFSHLGPFFIGLKNIGGHYDLSCNRAGQIPWVNRVLTYPDLSSRHLRFWFNQGAVAVKDETGHLIDEFIEGNFLTVNHLGWQHIGTSFFALPSGLQPGQEVCYGQDPISGETYLVLPDGIRLPLLPAQVENIPRRQLAHFSGRVFRRVSFNTGKVYFGTRPVDISRDYELQTLLFIFKNGEIVKVKDEQGQSLPPEKLNFKNYLDPAGQFKGFICGERITARRWKTLDGILSYPIPKGSKYLSVRNPWVSTFSLKGTSHNWIKVYVRQGVATRVETFNASVSLKKPCQTIKLKLVYDSQGNLLGSFNFFTKRTSKILESLGKIYILQEPEPSDAFRIAGESHEKTNSAGKYILAELENGQVLGIKFYSQPTSDWTKPAQLEMQLPS